MINKHPFGFFRSNRLLGFKASNRKSPLFLQGIFFALGNVFISTASFCLRTFSFQDEFDVQSIMGIRAFFHLLQQWLPFKTQ